MEPLSRQGFRCIAYDCRRMGGGLKLRAAGNSKTTGGLRTLLTGLALVERRGYRLA